MPHYDCRVFPAAGVEPDDHAGQIARRARRWRFEFPTEVDQAEHDAVRAAAKYPGEQERVLADPSGTPSPTPTQLAVAAVEVHAPSSARTRKRGASGSSLQAPTKAESL